MRVVHFVPSLAKSQGGPSRSVPSLCAALAQHGLDVALVTIAGAEMSSEAQDAERILPVIQIAPRFAARHFFPVFDRSLPDLKKVIDSSDLVHVHGLWTPASHAACRLAVRSGRPLVVSPRGMLEPWAIDEKGLRKRVGLLLYQRADLIQASLLHATSEDESRQLKAVLGQRVRVVVVPNGHNLPEAPFTDDVKQRRIVFLSRIHKKKGLLLLVEAATRLAATLREEKWLIAIVGPDEDGHQIEVQRAIRDRAVGDLFRFYPPLDGEDKLRFLRSNELFILPTLSENFGMVIAEALAAGLPCITTKAAPWPELVERQCGWWCEPTVEGVTAALEDALAKPVAELREMGARGRRLIEERYSWASMASRMEQLYDRAMRSSVEDARQLAGSLR